MPKNDQKNSRRSFITNVNQGSDRRFISANYYNCQRPAKAHAGDDTNITKVQR